MPIDYVIPFVDCCDRNWLLEYKKYVSATSDWSNNSTRFRDWETLRYQLRSIERYMPWVRNIYIVLSISETQIPKWLNTENERVHIVWDWEIVPRECLPVFNSNVIDLYIPRIEGLNERFRESKNLTWLIYPLSLMMKGLLQNGNVKTRYTALRDESSINNLNFTDCDVIVLNDEYHDNYYYGKPLLINRLEEILPGKSEFEKRI